MPERSSDAYHGTPVGDKHEWCWRDGDLLGRKLRIFIDGQEVRRVRWCNVKSGLAELAVSGLNDEVLMAAGRHEIATVIVQGKIVVVDEDELVPFKAINDFGEHGPWGDIESCLAVLNPGTQEATAVRVHNLMDNGEFAFDLHEGTRGMATFTRDDKWVITSLEC